ncbi:MAG: rRNA (guanine966-N2)-methyltransferase [Thermosipho sp. (in: thermotogales)]|nr:rRNA (guanine966-N2)-methyltransferase [Thermosipho sp. (in: thermotogales)]MDN5324559.1 rRNA (guanine966-N2)-methyltransferase [Thermosipho sp. (in: thermotogales)]
MLRIETGIFKNRVLEMVPDKRTRYTPNKVRMALVSSLDVKNKIILDLCAGSGIVGFEFLSNGAKEVHFVETSPKAIKTIKENAKKLNVENKIKLFKVDARIFLRTSLIKYDIVFTDPPFGLGILNEIVVKLDKIISEEGIIVIEHSKRETLNIPDNLKIVKSKKFGEIIIDFLKLKNIP